MKRKTSVGNLELARRLRAAGIRIDIAEDGPSAPSIPLEGVLVYQTGGVTESMAFDLAGGTGFIVSLVITVNLSAFAISAFELELPWEDSVRLLEEPLEVHGATRGYGFGGRSSLEFDRDEVLNHYADVRRIVPRGTSMKGLLLGVGSRSIPDQFQHGATIPALVYIYDQYMRKNQAPISFWADRSEKRSRAARPISKRARLFDRPDPGFGHCSKEQHEFEDKK